VVRGALASPALCERLGALLDVGIDVVVVGVPDDGPALGLPTDAAGRLVMWAGPDAGAAETWARLRLVGEGGPEAVVVDPGLGALDEVIAAHRGVARPVDDPAWLLEVDGYKPGREREVESWLTIGNGRTGTRGSLEEGGAESLAAFYVAGLFGSDPGGQAGPELVRGPEWARLEPRVEPATAVRLRRTLDLRQAVLFRDGGGFRASRFASLADRAVSALEAEGAMAGEPALPTESGPVEAAAMAVTGGRAQVSLTGRKGGTASFAISTSSSADGATVRRLVAVGPVEGDAAAALDRAEVVGIGELRARHRRAWRERWVDADVVVDGDAEAQRALRFALYHLISAGDPESDRASIGARAMTGPGYRGHVFWDTEIFVLPFFIWTHPQTARALLAYRHRTLPAARAKAARLGYAGALYAWESADTGEETTPEHIWLPDGTRLTILTGLQEHHIAADVAWAVCQYQLVTGDDAFMAEMGAEIVLETARFWASRVTQGADGRLHIDEVIGPDEYHEGIDDNAYTNVLARWSLQAADRLAEEFPDAAASLDVADKERRHWRTVADGLVDGFDSTTLLYEQFAGFSALEGVRAVDLAPRPFTGEMVVGVERLRHTQIVKQADVIMLGLLLPEVVGPDVAAANYRYYEPRTSHGSSLSPAIHALVAARVGDMASATEYFSLAGGVDLDNRMGNAADGVHIATMGGLWQAAVFGFGGVRADADGDAVRIDPRLPPSWPRLSFPVQWRGARLLVEITADRLTLDLDRPAAVALGDNGPSTLGAGRFVAMREGGGWSEARRHDGMSPMSEPEASEATSTSTTDRAGTSLGALDAVIFDMDGVVTQTAIVHAAAWKKLFDAYLQKRSTKTGQAFVAFDEAQDYERYVDGKNRYDGVRSFLESRGITLPQGTPDDPPGDATVCAMGNGKDAYFLEQVRHEGVRPYESTVALIRGLRSDGKGVGLVSASRNAEEVLTAAGVVDLFDARVDGVVAADLGLRGKPDPAMFLEAARRLGVGPERAAVVEDALSGVAAGAAGNFALVIGVARAGQHDALLQAGADVVVADLAELPPAG